MYRSGLQWQNFQPINICMVTKMILSLRKRLFPKGFRALLVIALCLLFGDFGLGNRAMTASGAPAMEISFRDNLISVQLVDAPLIDVLQHIAEKSGFKAHFLGDLTEPVTLSQTDITLEKCLRLLTAHQSLSIATLDAVQQPGENKVKRITEIWVLGGSGTGKTVVRSPAVPVTLSTDAPDETDLPENDYQDNKLLDAILDNPKADRSSQSQAIQDLADIGDADAVMALASYMANADTELQQMLVHGIGMVHSDESTQVLGLVLETYTKPDVRRIALGALGKRKDEKNALDFIKEAAQDSNPEIKALAEQILAK